MLSLILVALPLICAAFIAFIPQFDLASIRQIVLGCIISWLIILCRLELELSSTLLLYGLGSSFAVTAFLKKDNLNQLGLAFFIVLSLLLSLSSAIILVTSIVSILILAHISVWLILYLVAKSGGPLKGSTILQTGLFFLTADWVFLANYVTSQPITLLVLLPVLIRLFTLKNIVDNSPKQILVLWLSTQAMIGAYILIKTPSFTWPTTTIAFIIAACAILWALHDKGRQTFGACSLMIFNSLFLLTLDPKIITLGLMLSSLVILSSQHRQIIWVASLGILISIPIFTLMPLFSKGWIIPAIFYLTAWFYQINFRQPVFQTSHMTRAFIALVFVTTSCTYLTWYI